LQRGLSLKQLLSIQPGPLPFAIDYRIAKGSAVWSANRLAVIDGLVLVVMAFGARLQRASDGAELNPAMLAVTSDATDAGIHVWLDHCGDESISRVARRAL